MCVHVQLPERALFVGVATSLNAVARNGSFGVLPNHVDLITALVPSVLLITLADGAERVFGIDEGVLIKRGHEVRIAVRRGLESDDLESLHRTIAETFDEPVDEERVARAALSRLEASMVRRFISLREPGLAGTGRMRS